MSNAYVEKYQEHTRSAAQPSSRVASSASLLYQRVAGSVCVCVGGPVCVQVCAFVFATKPLSAASE